jgi:TrmH family RNA methyltransferase
MLSKAIIKDIQSLQQKKHRESSGKFLAEGPKLVRELLDSNRFELDTLYATELWNGWNNLHELNISPNQCSVIPEHDLERIANYTTPNEVVAVFKQVSIKHPPSEVNGNITLVLDRIQDPGNLGTIIRSADWFGVKQIVCSPDTTDCYAPKVVQSTMASLARVNMHYMDLKSWLDTCKGKLPIWTTSMEGKPASTILGGKSEGVIIIGNEANGVSEQIRACADEHISIPGYGKAESLNAAVAASILLYAVRQSAI